MITLRTPKHITGPDYGVASLTPRAWYEAKYGVAGLQLLDVLIEAAIAVDQHDLAVVARLRPGVVTWRRSA